MCRVFIVSSLVCRSSTNVVSKSCCRHHGRSTYRSVSLMRSKVLLQLLSLRRDRHHEASIPDSLLAAAPQSVVGERGDSGVGGA